jgi:hypothetical protein
VDREQDRHGDQIQAYVAGDEQLHWRQSTPAPAWLARRAAPPTRVALHTEQPSSPPAAVAILSRPRYPTGCVWTARGEGQELFVPACEKDLEGVVEVGKERADLFDADWRTTRGRSPELVLR